MVEYWKIILFEKFTSKMYELILNTKRKIKDLVYECDVDNGELMCWDNVYKTPPTLQSLCVAAIHNREQLQLIPQRVWNIPHAGEFPLCATVINENTISVCFRETEE